MLYLNMLTWRLIWINKSIEGGGVGGGGGGGGGPTHQENRISLPFSQSATIVREHTRNSYVKRFILHEIIISITAK